MSYFAPLAITAIGLLCIAAGWSDPDWFMNNRRARLVASLLGRRGARWFYVALGLAFVAAGVATVF